MDANLWGRSIQCGVLDDPWTEPPEDVFTLTSRRPECPDQPAYVESRSIAAPRRRSTASRCPMLELIASLGTIAGAHGVGRIDMVENQLVGSKSREIYEAPAAVVLHEAHKELQKMVVTSGGAIGSRACQRGSTPTPSTTASGSRRCGRRSTPSSTPCRSASPVSSVEALQRRLPHRRPQVAVRTQGSRSRRRGARRVRSLDDNSLVRTIRRRARCGGIRVRIVFSLRSAAVRRRRDRQPRLGAGARSRRRAPDTPMPIRSRKPLGDIRQRGQADPAIRRRRRRRRAQLRRARAGRACRRCRPAAAYGPLAQRTGVAGSPALPACGAFPRCSSGVAERRLVRSRLRPSRRATR